MNNTTSGQPRPEKKEGIINENRLDNNSSFIDVMNAAYRHGIDIKMEWKKNKPPMVRFFMFDLLGSVGKAVNLEDSIKTLQNLINVHESVQQLKGGNQ